MANARSPDFKIELVRLSFPNLLKPQKMEKSGGGFEFKYNATLLYPKSTALVGKLVDGTKIDVMEAAADCAVEQWGDKAIQWIKDSIIKSPFLDGDGPQGLNKKTGQRHAGYEGHKFIRTSANEDRQPKLVTAHRLPVTKADELYPGCYVNAVVNLFAWENDKGGKGLSFGLNMVQFAKDGERLGGGGADPDAFFEVIQDEGEAPTETKSGKGAAGLFS